MKIRKLIRRTLIEEINGLVTVPQQTIKTLYDWYEDETDPMYIVAKKSERRQMIDTGLISQAMDQIISIIDDYDLVPKEQEDLQSLYDKLENSIS